MSNFQPGSQLPSPTFDQQQPSNGLSDAARRHDPRQPTSSSSSPHNYDHIARRDEFFLPQAITMEQPQSTSLDEATSRPEHAASYIAEEPAMSSPYYFYNSQQQQPLQYPMINQAYHSHNLPPSQLHPDDQRQLMLDPNYQHHPLVKPPRSNSYMIQDLSSVPGSSPVPPPGGGGVFIHPAARRHHYLVEDEPVEPFEKCPTICSMLACLFCPLTSMCAMPAFVLSLCSYADYRVRDYNGYQEKSDIARQLIITACIIGLMMTISLVVIGFFYYDVIFAFISDFVRLVGSRMRSDATRLV